MLALDQDRVTGPLGTETVAVDNQDFMLAVGERVEDADRLCAPSFPFGTKDNDTVAIGEPGQRRIRISETDQTTPVSFVLLARRPASFAMRTRRFNDGGAATA